jgi:two-component system, OmpR family, alkaline phosphatase synthesis response regulator PhoP
MLQENNNENQAIMIIEDDRIISGLLHHILVRRGYQVHIAADGRAASEMLERITPPQLVLLDVMLPFMDGFELLEQIRAKPDWSAVPIIMLTSKAQEKNIVRALEAGANDYVVKPFQPEELVARVRRFTRSK